MTKGAAFVVGGTGGLGSAICRRLSTEWNHLAIGYRSSREKALAVAASLPNVSCETFSVACDLSDRASIDTAIRETVEQFGAIGTMVFASGVEIAQPYVSQISEDQWREVIETELIGFTRIVSATLPHFRTQGFGNFVTVV